ncbi:MAG: cyclopropane-fatty-acyl-phospholipid synthase [Frankiaceae bacterium]|jgi:cyclopropane-fatty-acyl-phospholipid synthase|nr:cyclopropane-fatty-acyl-phospholipid synthase [Frankiaceae bacterium]MDX6226118.1 cyclopropane-fatty-acyl-phospholipid synthase [Frankiales bacterium]
MSAADRLRELLHDVLGQDPGLRVRAWDGSESGPEGAPATVTLRSRRALRRLAWDPNELGLGRAYVSGDIDVDGDLYAALRMAGVGRPSNGPGMGWSERAKAGRIAARLGAVGRRPAPPPEEARLSGELHTRRRDRAAVSHHYDVGNDFYRHVLGPSLVYSCAVWRKPPPACSLEDAQRDKLDLVCRKLALTSGMRLLDVGCGWGSMLLHAASEYGVSGVGITLSNEQATLARKRVAEAGLTDRIEIRLQDYREVTDGPFDAISSIGMAEHVGEAMVREYAAILAALVRPGGRVLNHAIARRAGTRPSKSSFIWRYVFPDGELLPLETTVAALESAGLEVRDVEALREHYALTLREWVNNLERNWADCVRLVGEGRARVWRVYMAGSALSFESGMIGINQVLAVRPSADGRSDMPLTREALLLGG